MLSQITSKQFLLWRAYEELEPFGEERADLRAASIVQALVNTFRRKGTAPASLKDCMLRFQSSPASPQPRTAQQARDDVRRTMEMLTLIYSKPNAKPKKRRR